MIQLVLVFSTYMQNELIFFNRIRAKIFDFNMYFDWKFTVWKKFMKNCEF